MVFLKYAVELRAEVAWDPLISTTEVGRESRVNGKYEGESLLHAGSGRESPSEAAGGALETTAKIESPSEHKEGRESPSEDVVGETPLLHASSGGSGFRQTSLSHACHLFISALTNRLQACLLL